MPGSRFYLHFDALGPAPLSTSVGRFRRHEHRTTLPILGSSLHCIFGDADRHSALYGFHPISCPRIPARHRLLWLVSFDSRMAALERSSLEIRIEESLDSHLADGLGFADYDPRSVLHLGGAMLASLRTQLTRKPNQRPGVDAGWRVLSAFGRHRPDTTQAER